MAAAELDADSEALKAVKMVTEHFGKRVTNSSVELPEEETANKTADN